MIRLLAGLIAACAALSSQAADLVGVYRDALANDPVYASARASYAATQERLPQGRAGLLPSVGLAANYDHTNSDTKFKAATIFAGGQREFNSYGLSLSLTQPVYRPQNITVYDQAKLQVDQADHVLNLARQDLIVRVAQAYFDVLLSQDSLAFTQAQKVAIAQQLEQAKVNFEVGTSTITDTHEAQARYDLVVAQEIAARNDLEVKKRTLQRIVGKPVGEVETLSPRFQARLPEPNDIEAWASRAEESNLSILVQQAALEIAALDVRRNQDGHKPTVDLVATLSSNTSEGSSTTNSGSTTDSAVIGVQLNLPIYSGGLVTSRVREAVSNQEKARQDLENARRAAALASREAFLGVASGAAQVKALEQALTSSQTSLESSTLGQEVGVRTAVDVLNARQQVFSARRDLAQARYNHILATLRLKQAVGTLGDADLDEANRLLGGQ